MKPETHLRAAGAVILVGLVALSGDLRWAWQHAPYDRGAGWVALVWLGLAGWGGSGRARQPTMGGLVVAVALGLVSVVGDLNVARHAALVSVVISWIPRWSGRVIVGLSGVAWWPALGWAAARLVDDVWVIRVRVGWLAVGATVWLLWWRPREAKA